MSETWKFWVASSEFFFWRILQNIFYLQAAGYVQTARSLQRQHPWYQYPALCALVLWREPECCQPCACCIFKSSIELFGTPRLGRIKSLYICTQAGCLHIEFAHSGAWQNCRLSFQRIQWSFGSDLAIQSAVWHRATLEADQDVTDSTTLVLVAGFRR